jgi:signal recognition particle receptor subunit beta
MVVISYSGKEANGKIVYYGPGLGGKTTNLEFIYDSVPASSRGKMVSMKTQTDRTLFFDFLPLDLGELGGFKTRFLLYTVPGQVFYNATRKLVLRGADAIAFIADSQRGKMEENRESLENLKENLAEYDLCLDDIPWVIQYNKRDLPEIYTVEELNKELNPGNVPFYEAVATEGTGVFETFRGLSKLLLEKLSQEIGQRMVIGRHFGKKQEEEPADAVQSVHGEPEELSEAPVEVEGIETEDAEAESIEAVASSGAAPETEYARAETTEEEPSVGSDFYSDELRTVEREQTDESIQHEGVSSEPDYWSEPVLEEDTEQAEETEPIIQHDERRPEGFFSDVPESPPLEADITREEVLLSEPSGLEPAAGSVVEEEASDTQQLPQEPIEDETRAEEERQQVQEERELAQEERAPAQEERELAQEERAPAQEERELAREERAPVLEEMEQTLEDEPSFVGIIRRNNVGVFERSETSIDSSGVEVSGEPVSSEDELRHVIEVPIELAEQETEKEIILTVRLKLKREKEKTAEPSDEFLLDGITR